MSVENNAVVVALGLLQPTAPRAVLLVGHLPEAASTVTRGENAGRELHEFNIERSIPMLGSW
jgi:hypothetical protein